MPMIISFSGRKHSGKTHLAKICSRYGYTIINFADPLKQLVCECLGVSRNFLDNNKETKFDIPLRLDDKFEYLSCKLDIPICTIEKTLNMQFCNIRQILQVIGTELIRMYNPLWHVKHTQDILLNKPYGKFCIADTRFPNEKDMLEKLGAECWFIIRPDCMDISNHVSEISLDWTHFGYNIIINNSLNTIETSLINYINSHSDISNLRDIVNSMLFYNINHTIILNTINHTLKCLKLSSFEMLCSNLMICTDYFVHTNKMLFYDTNENNTKKSFSFTKQYIHNLKYTYNSFIIENAKKYVIH